MTTAALTATILLIPFWLGFWLGKNSVPSRNYLKQRIDDMNDELQIYRDYFNGKIPL